MNKPTFDELKNNRIAVNIKSLKEGEDFLQWVYNSTNSHDITYEIKKLIMAAIAEYGENAICISLNYDKYGAYIYCDKHSFKDNNFKIIEWSDFMENNNLEERLQQAENKLKESQEEINKLKEELKKQNEDKSKGDKLKEFWKEQTKKYENKVLFRIDYYEDDGIQMVDGKKYLNVDIRNWLEIGGLNPYLSYTKKRILHDKILNELYLFAKSRNNIPGLEEIRDSDNCIFYIQPLFNDSGEIKFNIDCYSSLVDGWIPFRTKEVAKEALEMFRSDLEEYYNMEW